MAADSVRAMSSNGPSIAVVGGGFAGVGAVVMLRRAGYDDVTVFERGERVGGVWNHNTYPGAACDVPSHLYEFSFEPNPRWSRRYAPQAEIQDYVERVAERHGVLSQVRANTEVVAASWDGERTRWVLETTDGPAFHTAEWRHDVDLTGKRVAIIGTGCSAIQTAPAIQPQVAQLDIYQRSPGWTFPKMDYAYSERATRLFERFPALQRLDRAA